MQKKNVYVIAVLAVAIGTVFYVKQREKPQNPLDGKAENPKPAATTSPAHAVKEALPRLLDLGANKCIPCKMMKPILEELRKEYQDRMQVDFIDVWEDPGAGEAHRVRSIPTQIFYDASGKEIFRHEGFFAKADILGKWKELGIAFATEAKK